MCLLLAIRLHIRVLLEYYEKPSQTMGKSVFSKKCDSDDIQICDKRLPRDLSALGAVRNCELPFWRSQLPPRRSQLPPRRCELPPRRCELPSRRSQLPPRRSQLPRRRCELPNISGAPRTSWGFPGLPTASWGGLGSSREVWGGQTAPQYIRNHGFP